MLCRIVGAMKLKPEKRRPTPAIKVADEARMLVVMAKLPIPDNGELNLHEIIKHPTKWKANITRCRNWIYGAAVIQLHPSRCWMPFLMSKLFISCGVKRWSLLWFHALFHISALYISSIVGV
ncbi:hypothetical protein PIB30_111220 [Stylosanthes scabra]|uniref:Uncharacterized protein n=1 Tax=Stylosanthes scabra TaxID=79078 RepID=A0ABU6V2S9_9FABA|nr:hypothetical protein [Stylosanthes scabra]